MARNRVSRDYHDEALEICATIKAKHPDILERGPDGLKGRAIHGDGEAEGPDRAIKAAEAALLDLRRRA